MKIYRGLGAVGLPLPVTPANYTDCGGGLSVSAGTPCPPPAAPIDPALIAQGVADWNARQARCAVYQKKEYAVEAAITIAAALIFPGFWKLLALPVWVVAFSKYPRSIDCDYGL